MHAPINVKSPNNTSKWQMGFNSAFKGLMFLYRKLLHVLGLTGPSSGIAVVHSDQCTTTLSDDGPVIPETCKSFVN
jgi:hypothetical protein